VQGRFNLLGKGKVVKKGETMKKYAYNEITLMQYIFLINGTQVATGILSLPRLLAEKAGPDGWIAILLGGFLSIVASIFIVKTCERYPDDTLYELSIRFFGKVIGKIIILIYMIYFILYGWSIFVNSILYIKGWLLPRTPDYLIMILFSIPTYLVARNGIRVIGRYNELFFYLMLWILFLFFIPLKDAHWLNFLPILRDGWKPVLSAVPSSIFSFIGFDIAFFLHPFLQKKQHAVKGVVIANLLTMSFYLFLTISCYAYFSPDGITEFNQPVLSLLKTIEFRFLERFDMVVLAVYLPIISTSWIPIMYFAAFCSSQLLNKQNHSSHIVVFLLLFIGLIFWIHPTWIQLGSYQNIAAKSGVLSAYIFPVFLWIYSWGFKKYHRRKIH
jgi:spore germination protein (amino acid permease)